MYMYTWWLQWLGILYMCLPLSQATTPIKPNVPSSAISPNHADGLTSNGNSLRYHYRDVPPRFQLYSSKHSPNVYSSNTKSPYSKPSQPSLGMLVKNNNVAGMTFLENLSFFGWLVLILFWSNYSEFKINWWLVWLCTCTCISLVCAVFVWWSVLTITILWLLALKEIHWAHDWKYVVWTEKQKTTE